MKLVVIFAYEGANLLDITGPIQVFASAGEEAVALGVAGDNPYRVAVASLRGGLITTSCGVGLNTVSARDLEAECIDTLLVSGGGGCRIAARDPDILQWLDNRRGAVRRFGSICTGAFILAAMGALDARRATTHWELSGDFSRAFPRVLVESDALFIEDCGVWTSAGVTAGIDMALAMVEQDFGAAVALATARVLVLFLKRSGGQSPYSAILQAQGIDGDNLRRLATWILENPAADMSAKALAKRARLSVRSLFRAFHEHLGATPREFVERARLETARRMLEQTNERVDHVARAAGFTTTESMRRAFKRCFQVSPLVYRERFSSAFDREESPALAKARSG